MQKFTLGLNLNKSWLYKDSMSQITEPKFILLDGVDKSGKSYAVSFLQDKYPDKLAFLLGGPKNKEIHPKNETPKERFFRFLDYNLERSEEIKQALAQGKHALTDWYFPRTVSSNSVIHREHCGREDLDSYVEHSRFARPDLVIPLLVDYDTLVKRLKQSPAEHAYEQDPILLLRF